MQRLGFNFAAARAGESFAFIDAGGGNNGDPNVGTLAGDADDTCPVSCGSATYPNCSAFAAALHGARIARGPDNVTFVVIDQPTHYLISNVVMK